MGGKEMENRQEMSAMVAKFRVLQEQRVIGKEEVTINQILK